MVAWERVRKAVRATRIYRDVLIVSVGSMKYPDLAAEITDWLLHPKGIQSPEETSRSPEETSRSLH